MANTIKLKKYSDIIEEYAAASEIYPGMLVELTAEGKVQAHSNAGQNAEKIFALENELEGKGIDDAYAEGDRPDEGTRSMRFLRMAKLRWLAVCWNLMVMGISR